MRAVPCVVFGICGSVVPEGRLLYSAAFGLLVIIIVASTGEDAFEDYITYQKYYQSIHIFMF